MAGGGGDGGEGGGDGGGGGGGDYEWICNQILYPFYLSIKCPNVVLYFLVRSGNKLKTEHCFMADSLPTFFDRLG
jgi:hypothetical protein